MEAYLQDFIQIDQFLYAFQLQKNVNDYHFDSIAAIPVKPPFNCGTIQASKEEETIKMLKFTLFLKQEEKNTKSVFGVFGEEQFEFFESNLPEYKIIDISKYCLDCAQDYRLLCLNEQHAQFHAKTIHLIQDVIAQNASVILAVSGIEDILQLQHFYNIKDFIFLNNQNNLLISNGQTTTTIFDGHLGIGIQNFLSYYANNKETYFAVLGSEQYEFFSQKFHHLNNIHFLDMSHWIPENLFYSNSFTTDDVELQARTINLIQEKLKSIS